MCGKVHMVLNFSIIILLCALCVYYIAVQEVGTESVRPNSGHPRYARCEYNIYPLSPHVSSSHSMCINSTHTS